jgi:HSP90 family molecular chaperone
LNRQHAIISQLVDGAADPELVRTWVRILYQLALLEAREVPTAAETRRFNRSLGNAFTASSLATL